MSFGRYSKIKKTRKDHQCTGCLEIIPKGSPAIDFAGMYEGYFCYGILCAYCNEYLFSHTEEFQEGWSAGDIGEYRKQEK